MLYKTLHSGEDAAAVAGVAACAARLEVRLVIRLDGVSLRALLADPLPAVTMLPPEMLLNPDEVAERVARVMVKARGLRANKHALPGRRRVPLQ